MKLFDTDIAIDHFHGHQAAPDFFANTLTSGEVLAIWDAGLQIGVHAGEALWVAI